MSVCFKNIPGPVGRLTTLIYINENVNNKNYVFFALKNNLRTGKKILKILDFQDPAFSTRTLATFIFFLGRKSGVLFATVFLIFYFYKNTITNWFLKVVLYFELDLISLPNY